MTESEERAFLASAELAAVELLRRPLEKYFRWKGADEPEELAAETIVRLLVQRSNGTDIRDLGAYAHGIAERVRLDDIERRAREAALRTDASSYQPGVSYGVGDERLDVLQHCLRTVLTPKERKLVWAYHDGDAKARKELASKLGISIQALRLRVLRIHRRLEACVRSEEKQSGLRRRKPGVGSGDSI